MDMNMLIKMFLSLSIEYFTASESSCTDILKMAHRQIISIHIIDS